MKSDIADLRLQKVQHNRGVGLGLSAALLSLLTACGAGGSGTLTGNLMDGYIKGAKICIDLNGNGSCDASEPTATTGTKGSFTVTAPTGTDLSAVHLLAEVPVGAVDEDTPNTPLTKAYKMMAPASTPLVVSPLTTVVSTHIKDGKTLSQAQAQARTDLGLPADHDFAKDYIAKSDSAAHNVAKMMATVLAEKVGSATPELAQLKAALTAAKPFAAEAYAASDVSNVIKLAKASMAANYTIMDFSESTATITPFEGASGEVVSNAPTGVSGKALKLSKPSSAQPWGGATVSLGYSTSVGALPLSSTAAMVSMKVYSPRVGAVIGLKIENASDNTQAAYEVKVNTTKADAWETMLFDFTTATGFSSAGTFNKISIFPEFFETGTGGNFYIDELKFLGASAQKSAALTAPVAAPSNYIVRVKTDSEPAYDTATGKALPGLYATGRYSASSGEAWWWGGDFADQIQSGYGFSTTNTAQWGFGIFIKNGGDGWAISSATNYKFSLGTNGECAGVCKVTLAIVSAANADCKATASVTLTNAALTSYTKALDDFTVVGCTTNTMAAFKQLKIAELHYQMLRADMQFTTSGDPSLYPNGLGVGGGIIFE